MKKTHYYSLITLLMLVTFTCRSQYQTVIAKSWIQHDITDENNQKEYIIKNKVKQKVLTNEQNSGPAKVIVKYDTEGRVIMYKAKRTPEFHITYTPDNKFSEIKIYEKGKLIERDSLVYDKGKVVGCYYFGSKGELFKQETSLYRDSLLMEYTYKVKKGDKFKEKTKQIYEYYDNGNKKRYTYYKNGKAKFYSVYDCNPVGDNHKTGRDSSYLCEKFDVDTLGNKIKITVVNDRVLPKKEIEYYNEKNELLARKTFELKSNEPLWFYYYKPDNKDYLEFISFKNNKEFYRIKKLYNEKGLLTEWARYSHGRLKRKGVISYNDKDIPEKLEMAGRNNKLKPETYFSYSYY